MFGSLWLAGGLVTSMSSPVQVTKRTPDYSRQIRELEHHVQRLQLLNQALWELLQERLDLTDEQLQQKAYDVDVRDGVEDGRMTQSAPLKCPECGRVSASKHWKCLYCGLEFQKPTMH